MSKQQELFDIVAQFMRDNPDVGEFSLFATKYAGPTSLAMLPNAKALHDAIHMSDNQKMISTKVVAANAEIEP